MSVSEDSLAFWAKGPAETESTRCSNAETAVKKAIKASSALADLDISVFAQGSYNARTNVRQDSDVDICVRYNGAFFRQYPVGRTQSDYGHSDSVIKFTDFKDMIQSALESYFGKSSVSRGNKAFDIHENTYRIAADVVPTFEYRLYSAMSGHNALLGVGFLTDTGKLIINWPDHTYNNGVAKNDATSRRYKRLIRILKRLRNKMNEEGVPEAKNLGSFLIEGLVWNCPNEAFTHDTYTGDLRYVLAHTCNETRENSQYTVWNEVNELKRLFSPEQAWTRQQVNAFLNAAWNYVGYK